MIGALIAVAVALAGAVGGLIYFGREAIVKSDMVGDMKEDRAIRRGQAVNTEAALDTAVGEIDDTKTRLERVITQLKRDHLDELELFNEQLELCGDDETRGRAAVVAVRRLLSAKLPDGDDSKTDPDDKQ